MTFEIELNGRSRTVSIERAGPDRFRVSVDGATSVVDAQRSGEFGGFAHKRHHLIRGSSLN